MITQNPQPNRISNRTNKILKARHFFISSESSNLRAELDRTNGEHNEQYKEE